MLIGKAQGREVNLPSVYKAVVCNCVCVLFSQQILYSFTFGNCHMKKVASLPHPVFSHRSFSAFGHFMNFGFELLLCSGRWSTCLCRSCLYYRKFSGVLSRFHLHLDSPKFSRVLYRCHLDSRKCSRYFSTSFWFSKIFCIFISVTSRFSTIFQISVLKWRSRYAHSDRLLCSGDAWTFTRRTKPTEAYEIPHVH
jgi:hypothetical protein